MIRRPPRSPLFPYPTLSGSPRAEPVVVEPVLEAVEASSKPGERPSHRALGVSAQLAPRPLREVEPVAIDDLTQPPLPRVERSEEHTSELQSRLHLVCRLLLE